MFFITGFGRSGTLWLQKTLDRDPNAVVIHEQPGDRNRCLKAFQGGWELMPAKLNMINRFLRQNRSKTCGEVNSYLRFNIPDLRELTPKVFHLTRRGDKVVASMMNRKAYTKEDLNHTGKMVPPEGSEYYDSWNSMSRLEKCCWLWQHTIDFMRFHEVPFIRFEDLLTDWIQFSSLTREVNINIPPRIWQEQSKNIINPNLNKSFTWKSPEDEEIFKRICGWAMEYLGYWPSSSEEMKEPDDFPFVDSDPEFVDG